MSSAQFYWYHFILLALSAILALISVQIQTGFMVVVLSWWCLITILMFHWGKSLSNSPSKYAFQNVISSSSLVNLFAVPTILFICNKIVGPINKIEILYFILTYCIFTAFKVYFLSRLGHQQTKR